MTWLLELGLLLAFLAIAAASVFAYGSKRWTDATRQLTIRLEAARIDEKVGSASPTRFHSRELEGLPAPVQRYFREVLMEGQPIVSALTIDMGGTFNTSASAEQWKPFTSQQRVITRRPGFLWDARVSMAPGLAVRVVWPDAEIEAHQTSMRAVYARSLERWLFRAGAWNVPQEFHRHSELESADGHAGSQRADR